MDLIDEAKLQAAADEVVKRASAELAKNISSLLAGLDGWTVTVTLHAPPKKSASDPQ
jgi:hypothetical protein